jgi:hypothetical protein
MLFGNLKVIILFTEVIYPDYLIHKVISDYLSIAFKEKIMITMAKHVIILVSIRSLATPYAGPHKLFKNVLKLPRCIFALAERKQPRSGNFLWRMKLKKFFSGFAISHAL